MESNRERAFSFVWIIALLIGGLIGTAAFEFYARGVSPVFFSGPAVASSADTGSSISTDSESTTGASSGDATSGDGVVNGDSSSGDSASGDLATGAEADTAPAVAPSGQSASVTPSGFSLIVADLIGATEIPGLKVEAEKIIGEVAAKQSIGLPSGVFVSFDIAGEEFNIDAALALSLLAGVVGLPLLYMLIIRPIFFFLPWFALGPLFGVLAFVLVGYVFNTVLLEQPMFFGLLGVEDGAPDMGQLGLAWLIGDVVYGLILGLFARLFAGK